MGPRAVLAALPWRPADQTGSSPPAARVKLASSALWMSLRSETLACLLESEVRVPFEDLIAAWDGEQVIVHFDRLTGSWMFICMHSMTLGPAAGGTRLRAYPSPEDGLADGLRLSEGMTWKAAVGGLPHGGGKGVIAVSQLPQGEVREGLLVRYAQLVNTLGGNFRTGPDMNITQADVDLVVQHTPYIFGRSISAGGSGSSGPDTAIGVLHGIRACVTHVFGEPTLEGRVVLIQGVGGVGEPLAELLVAEGATVIASDPDHERVAALVERLHVASVSPEEAIGTECDVFSPCAIGGILNADTIPRLRCRIVAGSANNQLATPEPTTSSMSAEVCTCTGSSSSAGTTPPSSGISPASETRCPRSSRSPTRTRSRRLLLPAGSAPNGWHVRTRPRQRDVADDLANSSGKRAGPRTSPFEVPKT